MKKITVLVSKCVANLLTSIAVISVNTTCWHLAYQEEIPKEIDVLRKKDENFDC